MIQKAGVVSAVFFLLASCAAAQMPTLGEQLLDEQFEDLNTLVWCPCQINLGGPSKLEFLTEDGISYAHVPVIESDIGGNRCKWNKECKPLIEPQISMFSLFGGGGTTLFDETEAPENLGPSLIVRPSEAPLGIPSVTTEAPLGPAPEAEAAAPTPYPPGGPYCTKEKEEQGKANPEYEDGMPCAQRQELRLQNLAMHPFGTALLYSIRFRMEADVPDEDKSVRWVIGQWKQEPAAQPGKTTPDPNWGPSPFLSQRFDDGVLHVAVQDRECRCLVAAADDPDNPQWTKKPQQCFSTREGAGDQEKCETDIEAVYGADPLLPDARGEWVTLRYLVSPGRNKTGAVQVFAGDRLVVTVTGSIGYDDKDGKLSFVKFKIGQYNDILPGPHAMDIDQVTVDVVKSFNLP